MKVNFYLIVGLIAGFAIAWWLKGCNVKPCPCDPAKDTTSIKEDTIIKKDSSISEWHVPEGPETKAKKKTILKKIASVFKSKKPEEETINVYAPEDGKTDTLRIVVDWLSRYHFGDTVLTKYGLVIIDDTIGHNKVLARKVTTNFHIPVVTKTVSLTEPKRNQLYIGVNAQGNLTDPLMGFGPSLMLKLKSDKIIELGALYGKSGILTYSAGLKFKISFSKH